MASTRVISPSVNFCLLLCIIVILDNPKSTASWNCTHYPRANGAKRRSGRKPGARVTNFALGKFKVIAHGS